MKSILILAAAAAGLLAGSASAQTAQTPQVAPSVRVSTAGKSAVQVKAEVYQAARKACQQTMPDYAYNYYEAKACLEGAARGALVQARIEGPTFAAR